MYDTAEQALAGHKLCQDDCCEAEDHHHKDDCHKPGVLFDALPEYSTPATPVAANDAVEPAVWDKLKRGFLRPAACPTTRRSTSTRTYLEYFRSCRFEEMRTFRKCITEFVLDPLNQPASFQTHLWRYPVRIDIAIEYLGISREEYIDACSRESGRIPAEIDGTNRREPRPNVELWRLYGFASRASGREAMDRNRGAPAGVSETHLPHLLRVHRAMEVLPGALPERRATAKEPFRIVSRAASKISACNSRRVTRLPRFRRSASLSGCGGSFDTCAAQAIAFVSSRISAVC